MPMGIIPRLVEFQFPPLREGRRNNDMLNPTTVLFQFPPLREGRRRMGARIHAAIHFNSRPCARGD